VVEKPLLTSALVLLSVAIVGDWLELSYYIEDFHGFAGQILAQHMA